mgnify:CR=1 FL=1
MAERRESRRIGHIYRPRRRRIGHIYLIREVVKNGREGKAQDKEPH